jgi:hypothetical protein
MPSELPDERGASVGTGRPFYDGMNRQRVLDAAEAGVVPCLHSISVINKEV